MNDSELFSQGNEAYVDGDYQLALQKYSAAIELNENHCEYFVKRATTYIRLGLYKDACADSKNAIKLGPQNVKAHQRQGESLYYLDEYNEAKAAFEKGLSIDEKNQELQNWIVKCNTALDTVDETLENGQTRPTMLAATECTEEEKTSDEKTSDEKTSDEKTRETDVVNTEERCSETPPKPLVRMDWYQTDTFVTITLMVKQCKAQNVNISYHENHVSGTVGIPSGGTYDLNFHLSHPIDITQCKTRILQSKIELKLKKKEGIHWIVLEHDNVNCDVKTIPSEPKSTESAQSIDVVHPYPSSRHVVKDWDRLAAEISKDDEDKEEGEAALNALFQKIYGEGADHVKKAMNKSFVESGGTVLSTNWDEVGKTKVERKAPDGMEWKSWEK